MAFTHVSTIVSRRHMETDRVVVLDLQDPDGWPLPPFTAGAHLDVVLPGGYVRQYSLCGDPADRTKYQVGVLDAAGGRGGSAALHRLAAGDPVPVSLPRNHFPLAPAAARHILIAGGIGVTPFMSMIPELARRGEGFELHVCTRSLEATPFLAALARLAAEGRAFLHHDGGDPRQGLDVRSLLAQPGPSEHVYCCGPAPLMDAVAEAAAHWPEGTVHFERFGAPPAAAAGGDAAYTIELARSAREIRVQPGQAMSAALAAAGIALDVSCQAGTCGACRTRYTAGSPIHRDLVLRPAERGEYLMPCVSGCAGQRLVLDL